MSTIFQIGDRFRLDPEAGVLTWNGKPTSLGPRAIALLLALVEHANEYLSRFDLLDAAWPHKVVEEGNLAVQIAMIRRALAGEQGERWIETLRARGYRFIGPVTKLSDARSTPSSIPRSNLPASITSFIGREREIVEIKRQLSLKRLVTIQGVGGIGKTRLALLAAAEVVDAYRDGVWLAELASIRDGALVSTTVAQLLGVAERPNIPATATLCAYLKSRQLLLVLDNCEHLIDACAPFVEAVLQQAKDVTIIATSREPLRLSSEQSYVLQPLSLPELASPAAIAGSEAVQLFVERVQAHLPDFELTPDRERVVAEICVHLDGIPLALELAAARARSLSVEQINGRLTDRFRLLTSGSRTAPSRQRTLRAVLDWSYDLISEDERRVLRRLAVFRGSFSVAAACAVASDTNIDEFAVIDLLSQLVSRSMLIADTNAGATRYRLLETTRAYAGEQLSEAQEQGDIARRHAAYFRKFFERAPHDWLRMSDSELRATYLPELDQVRAALDWAFAPEGDPAIGIPLAGDSGSLWGTLGLYGEGARRLEAAIACIEPHTPLSEQAALWRLLGRLMDEATPTRAHPAFERAAELYRRIGDPQGLAHTLMQLGKVLAFMGRYEDAEAALGEARPVLELVEVPWLRGLYFFNMAFLKNHSGDPAAAREHYEQARALFQKTGDEVSALAAFGNLANITWTLGDLDAAKVSFRETVTLVRASSMKSKRLLGWTLTSLASVLTERGELDAALAVAREGLPLLLDEGCAWIFVGHFALRAALAGRLCDAARLDGYRGHTWAANGATPQHSDSYARDRLRSVLSERLPAEDLERLRAEGAKLTEAEACRLALDS